MRNSWGRQAIALTMGSALALSPVAAPLAQAQQNIGSAQIVVNDVRSVVGTSQPAVLRTGAGVVQNEIIRTGSRSASRVVFQDNTNLSVGASSEVTLDRFVFDPNPARSEVALSIARGTVRFVTGSLPKSAYRITTPTVTIGVRGTILTIVVAPDGSTLLSVDEGIAIATAGGQTVTVNTGMTTSVTAGAPPSPPSPTPPTPPPGVVEMQSTLGQPGLAAGGAAGSSAGSFGTPLAIGLGAAAIAGAVILVTTGEDKKTPAVSTTGTAP
jgi:hypothetical protein